MREMFNCSLNGEDFLLLDPRLRIQDIQEQVKYTVQTANRPAYGKTPLGIPGRDELQISISFMIKAQDRSQRQGIINKVNGWAKSGWLTISTRPWQRIYAHCTQPANSEAFSWSADMSIVFTAYGDARFQDINPVHATISGSSGSASIRPLGTSACMLEADIVNRSSSSISSVSLTVGGKTLAFNGLGLAAGKTLKIFCDEHDILQASINGVGKLACRTPASADDLRLKPLASNTVQFISSATCNVTLYARGRYD